MMPSMPSIQFSSRRLSGLPAVLVGVVGLLLVAGAVALLVFVGLAVAVAGLAASAVAALVYGLRRKWASLAGSAPAAAEASASVEVREIEVQVLPASDQRR